jgi:hypothetical protein
MSAFIFPHRLLHLGLVAKMHSNKNFTFRIVYFKDIYNKILESRIEEMPEKLKLFSG